MPETTVTQMTAVLRRAYGDVDALSVETVAMPEPGPGELLLDVAASSINPADRYHMLAVPHMIRAVDGWRRPREPGLGIDAAGTVVGVGDDVEGYAVGDRVFGASGTAYAQFATMPVTRAAHIPDGVTFEQAACLPVAGTTALQALRHGRVETGQRVLVNGASGGVGHLTVQLAKARGAHVTGVCSMRNLDLVRSWGADEVIDYTTTDYTSLGQTWDVLIDNHGNHGFQANAGVLTRGGRWVIVNGPMTSSLIGPMRYIIGAVLHSIGRRHTAVQFTAAETRADLEELGAHVACGALVPHVERTFGLDELPAAMQHLASDRTRGKLLVTGWAGPSARPRSPSSPRRSSPA